MARESQSTRRTFLKGTAAAAVGTAAVAGCVGGNENPDNQSSTDGGSGTPTYSDGNDGGSGSDAASSETATGDDAGAHDVKMAPV